MHDELLINTPANPLWKTFGIRHHHGIDVPLFSLHSERSCGIGEFLDLLPLIDWCSSIHFDIVQLLPLNDTGMDASPYNALSAYALNPIHLSLTALPNVERYPELTEIAKQLAKLNHTQHIAYAKVREGKEEFLRFYYTKQHQEIVESTEYQHFVNSSSWLKGYALFRALKNKYQWISWEDWPTDIQNPTPSTLQSLTEHFADEIAWHCFVQYLCFLQLQSVKKYASDKGVSLLGDIPILISRDSADVWLHRDFFNLDFAAGAPPDFFNRDGQKWGFPLYNWDALAKQNYQWWQERLAYASKFYHLYRIDHVIGFFRIWAVKHDAKTGKEGKFIPEDKSSWLSHGETLLRMLLRGSTMLPIAEDLGDVPIEVRPCLQAFGICGTKVMRWERRWNEDKGFIHPEDYPAISLTTVSTHDSETVSLWWKEHPDEAQEFAKFMGWYYTPVLSREYLREIVWDSHHTGSLLHVNLLQEYLALVPGLTWPCLEDERINMPGIVSNLNWSYRFRPTVEEIVANTTLSHMMQELST